jgi:hypothetical protein
VPEFNPDTAILTIPRVVVGNLAYQVGLSLINSNPIQIQLVSAVLLP